MSASKTPFSSRIQRLFHGETPRRGHFAFAFLFLGLLGAGHLSFTTLGADAGAVDCLEEQGKDTAQPTPPAVEPVVPPTEHVYEITPDELADMVTEVPDPYFGVLIHDLPAGNHKSVRTKTCSIIAVDALPSVTVPVLRTVAELPVVALTRDTLPPVVTEHPTWLKGAPPAPLFVIDGVVMQTGSVKDLDPADIEAINVFKGTSATDRYGETAVNGVIEITLKKDAKPAFDFVPAEHVLNGNKMAPGNFTEQYERFTLEQNEKVGYILDGKKVRYARIQELLVKDIESVKVYKGSERAKEFGFRKMDGVIVILTK